MPYSSNDPSQTPKSSIKQIGRVKPCFKHKHKKEVTWHKHNKNHYTPQEHQKITIGIDYNL